MKREGELVRLGWVGSDTLSAQHLARALEKSGNACMWSVFGRDEQWAVAFAKEHAAQASVVAFTNLDAFLEDQELEAVVVAAPDYLHVKYLTAILSSGKPVFVEKPLCTAVDEGLRIAELVAQSNALLDVGYHLRHHAGLRSLAEQIHNGMLGTVYHMRVQWTCQPSAVGIGWEHEDDSASRLLRVLETCTIDLIRWMLLPICGEITDMCSMVLSGRGGRGTDGSVTGILQFTSGACAEFVNSVLYGSETRVEIWGERGAAECVGVLDPLGGGEIKLAGEGLPFPPVDLYVAEIESFAGRLRGRKLPFVDVLEGLRNIDLLQRMSLAKQDLYTEE